MDRLISCSAAAALWRRPQLAAAFTSFHVLWAEQTAFAVRLVRNLVKDLQAVAAAEGQPRIAQLRRFLALCNCVASFAKACGKALSAEVAGKFLFANPCWNPFVPDLCENFL